MSDGVMQEARQIAFSDAPQFDRTLVRDRHSSVTWRISQVTDESRI